MENIKLSNQRSRNKKLLDKINYSLRVFLACVRRVKFYIEIRKIKRKKPLLFKMKNKEIERKHKKYWSKLAFYIDPLWFRFSSNVSGKSDYKIVPTDIYRAIIDRTLNNTNYADYESDKNYYERLFEKNLFPKAILRKNLGQYMDGLYNFVSEEEAKNIFENIGHNVLIKPTINTHSGNNIKILNYRKKEFYDNNKAVGFKEIDKLYGDDYIIQEVVKTHEFFSQFNKSSANTLRIHTYRSVKDEKINILYSFIRMGRKESVVDNVGSGGLMCIVNELGYLNEYAINSLGDRFFKHPDSKIRFKGLSIPFYKEAFNVAKEIASKMPSQRLIGFDIVVLPDGKIKIIEINLLGIGIYVVQLFGISLFGDYTDEIIEHCERNKYKNNYNILKI